MCVCVCEGVNEWMCVGLYGDWQKNWSPYTYFRKLLIVKIHVLYCCFYICRQRVNAKCSEAASAPQSDSWQIILATQVLAKPEEMMTKFWSPRPILFCNPFPPSPPVICLGSGLHVINLAELSCFLLSEKKSIFFFFSPKPQSPRLHRVALCFYSPKIILKMTLWLTVEAIITKRVKISLEKQ